MQCPGWTERPSGGAAVGAAGGTGPGGGPAAPPEAAGADRETPAAGRHGRPAGAADQTLGGRTGAARAAPPTYRSVQRGHGPLRSVEGVSARGGRSRSVEEGPGRWREVPAGGRSSRLVEGGLG